MTSPNNVSRRFHDRNVYGKINKETLPAKRIADRISTRTSKNCCCNHWRWADDTKIEKYKEKLKKLWTLKE
jgi:hypothetical protein